MLTFYAMKNHQLVAVPLETAPGTPILWADLLNPTREEELLVEERFGVEVPTREEMSEIEFSSRLYQEKDAYFLTATLISQADTGNPQSDAVTFVLTPHVLVSLRYSTPRSFDMFVNRCERPRPELHHPANILLGLLDTITDRMADVLEFVARGMDEVSRAIFRADMKPDLQKYLRDIGLTGDLISRSRESLVSLTRMAGYLAPSPAFQGMVEHGNLLTIQSDLASLSDHANFLTSKINFMLDAILGMISIEQNNIFKIFSVASIIFLPPTLVAGIYGMNFEHMPELKHVYGYPFALCVMLLSAYLPYRFFKRKGWL